MESTELLRIIGLLILLAQVVTIPLVAWAGAKLNRIERHQSLHGQDLERMKGDISDHEKRIRPLELRRMNGQHPTP